ncbi:hypothetical protein [Arthrobacter sp. OV608]|uniref:hypothetical protein n=1 Tax=Arthrobacter sp. OV608 TaxID=1882768 RepID=UPI0011145540|nr:hypothetical protein [Arthrobacter sp. OV608]
MPSGSFVVDVGLPRSCTPRHRSYRIRLASAPYAYLASAVDVIEELLHDVPVTGHAPFACRLDGPPAHLR